MNILEEAEQLINGDRAADYGPVSENFDRIARMWSAYKSVPFSWHDVSQMMILVKVARQASGYHRDSNVDIAGYAALDEQCQNAEQPVEADRAFYESLVAIYDGLPDMIGDDEPEGEGLPESAFTHASSEAGGFDETSFSSFDAGVVQILTSPVLSAMASEPVQPRVWDALGQVPHDVEVEDGDEDRWRYLDGKWQIRYDSEPENGFVAYDHAGESRLLRGPYTEVIA